MSRHLIIEFSGKWHYGMDITIEDAELAKLLVNTKPIQGSDEVSIFMDIMNMDTGVYSRAWMHFCFLTKTPLNAIQAHNMAAVRKYLEWYSLRLVEYSATHKFDNIELFYNYLIFFG